MSNISNTVRTLADLMQMTVNDKGQLEGNNKLFVEQLPTQLREHNGFDYLRKEVGKILKGVDKAEEKTDAIIDAAYEGSVDVAKAFQAYRSDFFAATHLAAGEAAVELVKANPETNRVIGQINTLGRDRMSFVYDQNYQTRIPGRDGAEDVIENRTGRVVVKDVVSAQKNSASAVKVVKDHISELAGKGIKS